ncbi:unnamed protein product [Parajaminaea phylloscopi]
MQTSKARRSESAFQHDTSLLNPSFEVYKLANPLSPSESASYRLPSTVSLSSFTRSDSTPGFKELKDSVDAQKLVAGSTPGHLAYIDDSSFVILAVIAANGRPNFHPLHRCDLQSGRQHGPKSLLALPGNRWLVSAGDDRLTLLRAEEAGRRWTCGSAHTYTLPESDHTSSFRLVEASETEKGDGALVLLQRIRKAPIVDAQGKKTTQTHFEACMVELSLETSDLAVGGEDGRASDQSHPAVRWSVSGDEPVYHAELDLSAQKQHLLIGETAFSAAVEDKTEDKASVLTPPTTAPPAAHRASSTGRRPIPPYSWLQTDDSLTLVFQLPASVQAKDIRIHFSPQGMSIHLAESTDLSGRTESQAKIVELNGDDDDDGSPQDRMRDGQDDVGDAMQRTAKAILRDHYASRSLWGPVNASDCVWTWERLEGAGQRGPRRNGSTQGLLTIHLEKKNEGVRWPQVFVKSQAPSPKRGPMIGGADSATGKTPQMLLQEQQTAEDPYANEEEAEGEEPEETVDPSELLSMLEGLEKYTVDAEHDGPALSRPGGGGFELGGMAQRESLLHDSLEPEDADVGRPLRVTTVNGTDGSAIAGPPVDDDKSCLALPLPYAAARGDGSRRPLVIRHDLDGLAFLPPNPATDGQRSTEWVHDDTLPALSFVLASKRDLRGVWVHQKAAAPRFAQAANAGATESLAPSYRSVVLAVESPPPSASIPVEVGASTGAAGDSAGNLFVYYSPAVAEDGANGNETKRSRARSAPSRVIRLEGMVGTSGSAEDALPADEVSTGTGAFVGIAAVTVPVGPTNGDASKVEAARTTREVLCILCEKRLLVLHGVL